MHLSFCWTTIWFITFTVIHKWAKQNYDCIFFAVQLFVFLKLIVFCLHRLALYWSLLHLLPLSQNWKMFSRCVQAHPIFCPFCWLTCVLGTSLYHFSGNFLPLFVGAPSHIFLFQGLLSWVGQQVSDWKHGPWSSLAWVQILTDNWTCNLGSYLLSMPKLPVRRMGIVYALQRVVLNLKGVNTYKRPVHVVSIQQILAVFVPGSGGAHPSFLRAEYTGRKKF